MQSKIKMTFSHQLLIYFAVDLLPSEFALLRRFHVERLLCPLYDEF